MQMKAPPELAPRIETLLREELIELGENPAALEPHEIAANMVCTLGSDSSMTYSWKGTDILYVFPDTDEDGTIVWRMFTRELS